MTTTVTAKRQTSIDRVVAEDAPIGVQLWPTVSPMSAPNFTLEFVEIVRTADRTFVRWIYENGKTRVFKLGERVVVSYPAGYVPEVDR